MKTHLLFLFISLIILKSESLNCNENNPQGHPSDLRVFHINSPCTPFKQPNTVSWESTLLQDKARFLYLSSLAAKKPSVPIASGRSIVQSPTYVVRANIGTPAQPMLVALDTSNDAAWIPCSGCVGCASSVLFDPSKSTSSSSIQCDAPQCKQVIRLHCIIWLYSLRNRCLLRMDIETKCHFNLTITINKYTKYSYI